MTLDNIWGERFYGYRTAAWHELGVVSDVPWTAAEAVRKINMDYTVQPEPLVTASGLNTKLFALVRSATHDAPAEVLGTCGPDYTTVQNMEIADMLDAVAEKTGWNVETAGALGKGETMFLTLDTGRAVVTNGKAEEELAQYFLVTNTHDIGRSLRVAYTPVRVVCQNTLIAGLDAANLNIGLTHHKAVHDDLALTIKLAAAFKKAQAETNEAFNRMAVRVLTPDEIAYVLAAAYVLPKVPQKARAWSVVSKSDDAKSELSEVEIAKLEAVKAKHEYECSRLEVYRKAANERLTAFNDEQKPFANTAWALWQAITETENYRRGSSGKQGVVAQDVLFGRRADIMARGYKAAVDVVDNRVTV